MPGDGVSKAKAAVPEPPLEFGTGWDLLSYVIPAEPLKVTKHCCRWGHSSQALQGTWWLPWTPTDICFSCRNSVAADPLAELTPGSAAVEVPVLQNVQWVLGANTEKSDMLIIPPGDVNHVGTRIFGIFHFRHSNIGSSDLSHWNCRPSLDCLCCPASVKLQNVLSMYILYVRCFSSLLDSCPVTPGIVSCKGCSAEHSEIPLSAWKCSCEKGQLCSNDRVTRTIK